MTKTLEEIEAVHMARAARKAGIQPDDAHLHDDILPPGDDEIEAQSTTDERDDEIRQLKQQLAAMQGRVAPSQQQAEEYRRHFEEERRARDAERSALQSQLNELRSQLEARNEQQALDELLTDEERDYLDPMQLAVFQKIAKAAMPKLDVRAETAKLLEERESKLVAAYREEKLTDSRSELSKLYALSNDPEFIEWTNQDENDDFDPLVRSMLSATTERDIDRYAKAVSKRIAKFNESRNNQAASRKTDAKTSLTRGMQRRPRNTSDEEVKAVLAEASRLARSRDPADRKRAEELLNSV